MDGQVNSGFGDLVRSRFGGETRERIRRSAGFEAAGFANKGPDQVTYRLVTVALKTPARDRLAAS